MSVLGEQANTLEVREEDQIIHTLYQQVLRHVKLIGRCYCITCSALRLFSV
jgi:hypothetical protein